MALLIGLVLLGLVARWNFLLFHCFVEWATVSVACALFLIAWNLRGLVRDAVLLFLGVVYGFVAFIELLHTLAYTGMGILPGGADLATQLWVTVRGLEAVAVAAAPSFVGRRLPVVPLLAGLALTTLVLLGLVFSGTFPSCFVEGVGLTPFKVASEWVIIALVAVAAWRFRRVRWSLAPGVFGLLMGSLALTAVAEVLFSSYRSVTGPTNVLGHLFRLGSFYLVYLALARRVLVDPMETLFGEVAREARNNAAALASEEERFQLLAESVDSVFLISHPLARGMAYASPAFETLFGRPRGELYANPRALFDAIHPDDRAAVEAEMARNRAGAWGPVEYRIVRPDGGVRYVTDRGFAVLEPSGAVRMQVGVVTDVTRTVEARLALEESERRLSVAVAASGTGVYEVERSRGVTYVSPAWRELVGAPDDPAEGLVAWYASRIPPHERSERGQAVAALLEGRVETMEVEFPFETASRGRRWFHEVARALELAPEGGALRIVGALADVTERRQEEESLRVDRDRLDAEVARRTAELRRRLDEKEVLLREIHHRVKNNLQVVASLLSVHGARVEDERARLAFDDSRNRIRALADIHERLYRSDDLGDVEVGDFLGPLVHGLVAASAPVGGLAVELGLEGGDLDLDTAIPLGLMVNELVVNVIKHAVPAGARTLRVGFVPDDGGGTLRVADDGPGFPDPAGVGQGGSLGFLLVTTLATQLGAGVNVSNDGGAVVTVRLPARRRP